MSAAFTDVPYMSALPCAIWFSFRPEKSSESICTVCGRSESDSAGTVGKMADAACTDEELARRLQVCPSIS